MAQAGKAATNQGSRAVIANTEELRAAVIDVVAKAHRGLAILTPNLEPEIYDHEDFLDALKRFVLAKSFARIRVLITQPERAMKSGNQFVQMGRRLNSYIEFRNLADHLKPVQEAYCIADGAGLVYRIDHTRHEGMVDTNAPTIAQSYLARFDTLWNES
jgi:hypothetical protein